MYQRARQSEGRSSKAIGTFGIEDNQDNIVTDHRRIPRTSDKYIYTRFVLFAKSKYVAIEAEEELDEDDKGSTILKSLVVKVIKDMRRKKATGINAYILQVYGPAHKQHT